MTEAQEQWIDHLYREMYDILFRYSDNLLKDAQQAEETVQEAFRIACDKPEPLMQSPNPKGWLMNTLKGVLRNQQRKNRKQQDLFVEICDQECIPQGEPDPVALDLLYADVAESREFQLLRAVSEGETVKEIARRMGISEDSCKKRVQRSRRFLRKRMETNHE